jgi:hypothetical protein
MMIFQEKKEKKLKDKGNTIKDIMTNSGHREQASSSFFMPSTMISMGEDPM